MANWRHHALHRTHGSRSCYRMVEHRNRIRNSVPTYAEARKLESALMALGNIDSGSGASHVYTTPGVEINGHLWVRSYAERLLVAIICTRCGRKPIDVFCEDLTVETCRGGKE